jgi:integrase
VIIDDFNLRITTTIWRRHSAACKHKSSGRYAIKCDCPLWGDGCVESVRVFRKSLNTRSLQVARKRLAGLLEQHFESLGLGPKESSDAPNTAVLQATQTASAVGTVAAPLQKTEPNVPADPGLIANAAKAYLANCETNGVKPPTIRKYRNTLNHLAAFVQNDTICRARKARRVADLKVIDLDRFRASRKIAPISSSKELETLRGFWEFCTVRELCLKNIAAVIKPPVINDQNDVVPYTAEEVEAIIAACNTFGLHDYERKRALAAVLTLRYTALRISDVALMRRDRISRDGDRWRIFVRTTKNNAAVYLPIPDEMVEVLNSLPAPRKSDKNCPYFFWNGNSKSKSQISELSETLAAVFLKSGVSDAHAHRFRHTLATELLGAGASFETVADILGNSVEIVKKHYAKWSKERQERVDDAMEMVLILAFWFGPPTAVKFGPLGRHWLGFMDGATEA